jgi:hypothetical protein
MTQRDKQQLTDEQMNELVFADVDDPSAWGDPVLVRPSKGPRRLKSTSVASAPKRLSTDST